MGKRTLEILCASLCLSSLLSFSSNSMSAKTNNLGEVHTEYSIAKDSVVTQPILLADRVEVGKKLASEKKIRDLQMDKALEEERLEYPAIEVYGEDSWNDRINPVVGTSASIPTHYEIDLSDFTMPTDMQRVTSRFGYRRRFGRMHFGTDLDLNTGDPVKSAFDGRVRVVDYDRRGYGHYIIVRHPNGLETLYGHLSKTEVNVGDIVRSGDVIGLGGSTGRSTGSHLHFEARFMGIAINPETLFDFSTGSPKLDTFAFNRGTISTTRGSRTRYSSTGVSGNSRKYSKSSSSNSSSVKIHRIRQGETLGGIARQYGVSVSQLKRLNGMGNSSFIRAGKTLRVR